MWFEYVNMTLYFISASIIATRIAGCDSTIAVKTPDSARVILFIFSFRRSKISVFAVIFQVYTYIMTLIFIVSRFISLKFLTSFIADVNGTYILLLRIQHAVLIPLALIEIGICYLIRRKRR